MLNSPKRIRKLLVCLCLPWFLCYYSYYNYFVFELKIKQGPPLSGLNLPYLTNVSAFLSFFSFGLIGFLTKLQNYNFTSLSVRFKDQHNIHIYISGQSNESENQKIDNHIYTTVGKLINIFGDGN